MKIKTIDELIKFLKKPTTDYIILQDYIYELLIEQNWKCPLGIELKNAIQEGLFVEKG